MKMVLLVNLFLFTSSFSFAEMMTGSFVAQVVSVSGKVLHRNETNQNIKPGLLKAADKLYEGSILNTNSEGAVKILMTDRTIVDIGPSSLFKINDYKLKNVSNRTVELELEQGRMRASVNKKITDEKEKLPFEVNPLLWGFVELNSLLILPLESIHLKQRLQFSMV